jgi:hypothetical protein
VVAGLLTALVAYRLTRDSFVAWLAGIVTAGAVVVRLFPSLWMVGVYDLVGVVLFLLALLLFVDRRIVLAGVVFLAALLVKETTVPLVLVAAAYHVVYRSPPAGVGERARAFARELWPLVLALALWLVPKTVWGPSPFHFSEDDPYRAELSPSTIFGNLEAFLGWTGRTIVPSADLGGDIAAPARFTALELGVAAGVALALAALAALVARRRRGSVPASPLGGRDVAFLAVWYLGALAPVLVLANHRNSYYLVYSFPAFAILAAGLLTAGAGWLVKDRLFARLAVATAIGGALAFTIAQTYSLQRSVRDWAAWSLPGSALYPFALGQSAERVLAALERGAPELPRDASIVLHGVDSTAILTSAAPRLWYDNPELRVYESWQLEVDARGVLQVEEDDRPYLNEGSILVQPASASSRELVVIRQPEHLRALIETLSE